MKKRNNKLIIGAISSIILILIVLISLLFFFGFFQQTLIRPSDVGILKSISDNTNSHIFQVTFPTESNGRFTIGDVYKGQDVSIGFLGGRTDNRNGGEALCTSVAPFFTGEYPAKDFPELQNFFEKQKILAYFVNHINCFFKRYIKNPYN